MPENAKRRIRASGKQTWKRGFRSKGPSTSMKVRANAVILSVILCCAAVLTINLFKIMVLQHKEYTDKANSRQFGTTVLPAARGSIYDANGAVLAQSATVYQIFLDPSLFRTEMEMVEDRNKELEESARKKREAGESAEADTVDPDDVKEQLISYLTEALELTEEEYGKLREAFDSDKRYYKIRSQVEKSKADRIIEYISDFRVPGSARSIKLSSVSRMSDTKRYYPQNELAAAVIGFNNSDGHGVYGIESYYDSYLSGVDGKNITARDANGNEMPYRYSKTYPAQDGDDVYVTIDMTLQTYLENAMTDMVSTYRVAKRGAGIILNAKTGAVMAMASVGGFDPNAPYDIYDPVKAAEINGIADEKERNEALRTARETQWRNKCVTETYIPGSVFKVYTASAALEENKVSYYADRFTCTGSIVVAGQEIHCSHTNGHGTQNFEEILSNSCNPAFIELGQRLGKEQFCQYFAAFGLTERTGIDLPAEGSSIYTPLSRMGPVELAASSYGQNNSITPIEMAAGYAAVVNGGYLLQPYVVSKIVDHDGNIVLTNEKTVRRQVISAETSAQMRKALQFVVDDGSNAYIKGYKIGGKTGTSQKLMGNVKKGQEQFVASFCCFAPADDPEIVMLILADEPDKTMRYYGNTVVAPYSRQVFEKALPYLGYYPEYTAEEAKFLDVTVPLLVDLTVDDAKKTLENLGLHAEIIGSGVNVNNQYPMTGKSVAKDGTVLLFTGSAEETAEQVTVPSLTGIGGEEPKTLAEVNQILSEAGLNYVAKGSMQEDSIVLNQSVPAGTTVDRWTVIELDLGISEDRG
ncbi:MAG: PASTA domain-containing protein [Oscillospiraceae bacterium]|nr:PASTA domain-containing protein [Oscillospiraceae bacterium]